jgi:hypothetical protein
MGEVVGEALAEIVDLKMRALKHPNTAEAA